IVATAVEHGLEVSAPSPVPAATIAVVGLVVMSGMATGVATAVTMELALELVEQAAAARIAGRFFATAAVVSELGAEPAAPTLTATAVVTPGSRHHMGRSRR